MTKPVKSPGRVARLLRLISLLQGSDGWTVETLMDMLKISRRTLFRDLKCLEQAGIPASYSPINGYQIIHSTVLPMKDFTANEILGLMMLGKIGLCHADHPMVDHGLTALFKSVNQAPTSIREACRDIMSYVDVRSMATPQSDSLKKVFFLMLRAIDEKNSCTVEMKAGGEIEAVTYDLLPHKIFLNDKGWLVSGNNLADDSELVIELAQIEDIDLFGHV